MDEFCGNFLTGAALAKEQDRGVAKMGGFDNASQGAAPSRALADDDAVDDGLPEQLIDEQPALEASPDLKRYALEIGPEQDVSRPGKQEIPSRYIRLNMRRHDHRNDV